MTKEKDPLSELDTKIMRGLIQIAVLKMIKKGHSHGYDMLKICCTPEERKISSGLLYSTLNELEKNRYLSAKWVQDSKKPRKKYSLTTKGRELLDKGVKKIRKNIEEIIA